MIFLRFLSLTAVLGTLSGCDEMRKWHSEQHVDAAQAIYEPVLPVPEARGFYTHYGSPDREYLGIMLRDIGQFRDGPISQEWLAELDGKLSTQQPYSIILRFAYDYTAAGNDATISRVLQHIDQLRPILASRSDRILVLQAGFVGAWGEWHTSQNGLIAHGAEIIDALSLAYPGYIQVRTPEIRDELLGYWSSPLSSRIGIHDDCFLASASDFGTYRKPTEHHRYYPVTFRGGETCAVSTYTSCDNALSELGRQRYVYLNSEYNVNVINQWKAEGCFDQINRCLGRWGQGDCL